MYHVFDVFARFLVPLAKDFFRAGKRAQRSTNDTWAVANAQGYILSPFARLWVQHSGSCGAKKNGQGEIRSLFAPSIERMKAKGVSAASQTDTHVWANSIASKWHHLLVSKWSRTRAVA